MGDLRGPFFWLVIVIRRRGPHSSHLGHARPNAAAPEFVLQIPMLVKAVCLQADSVGRPDAILNSS
jgi:hypothetical protein